MSTETFLPPSTFNLKTEIKSHSKYFYPYRVNLIRDKTELPLCLYNKLLILNWDRRFRFILLVGKSALRRKKGGFSTWIIWAVTINKGEIIISVNWSNYKINSVTMSDSLHCYDGIEVISRSKV